MINIDLRAAAQPAVENLRSTTAIITWATVEETATQIRNLRREINAVAKNISIGDVFKALREPLLKTSRHDKTAPGWVSIFAGPEGRRRFGCDRRIAEKHIQIFEAFHVGTIVPTCDLPSSFPALALLAKLVLSEKLGPTLLAKYVEEKRIHSANTEPEIRRIGISLGILEPKRRAAEEPSEEPTSDLKMLLKQHSVVDIVAALSREQHAQLHERMRAEIEREHTHAKADKAAADALAKAKAAFAKKNKTVRRAA